MSDQVGLIFFFTATVVSVVFVATCSMRQYLINLNLGCCASDRFWGKICCTRGLGREGSELSEQYNSDRVLAETLQRQLNEEDREREREGKRNERRMWYEYYMRPCTMVVAKFNLIYAKGNDHDDLTEIIEVQTEKEETDTHTHTDIESQTNISTLTRSNGNKNKDEFVDSDAEEIGETAKKCEGSDIICCDKDDENAALYLKISALDSPFVDGTCAFCLEEYQEGDEIVWSSMQCPHAFHKECLMLWLSKGKKRCPICRDWFVPGTKIDDQKAAHGADWQRALSEMEMELELARKREEQEALELQARQRREDAMQQRVIHLVIEPPYNTETNTTCNSNCTGNCTSDRNRNRNRDPLPETVGQNKLNFDTKATNDVELGSTILRNDSGDSSEHYTNYNSSGEPETSEILIFAIESQQTNSIPQ